MTDANHTHILINDGNREDFWRDVLVNIYTNMGYQQARRKIFERQSNFINAISLASASTAFATLRLTAEKEYPIWTAISLILIIFVSSCGLVFRWGDKARDAEKRYDGWTRLAGQVQRIGLTRYNDDNYHEWCAEIANLSLGEVEPNAYLFFKAEQEARRVMAHEALEEPEDSPPLKTPGFWSRYSSKFAFN